jgi:TonB family protein
MQYVTPNRRAGTPFWAIVAAAALAAGAVVTIGAAQEPSALSDAQPQPRPATGTPRSAMDKTGPIAAAASPSNQKSGLPFDEEIPPGGVDNLMFSDAAIRYCIAQIIRVDAVRSLVDRYERPQVEYFNGLVADYNNRCAHYRYMEGARENALALVEPNRAKIEKDAREAYRKRFAGTEKEAASKASPSVGAPLPAQSQQAARSPAAASSTPLPAAPPGTTAPRAEVKQQPPSTGAPPPSTPSAQAASPPATKLQPELKQQPQLATSPSPSMLSAQVPSSAAPKPQPEVKQQPSSTIAPPPSPAAVGSPATTTSQPTAKQPSQPSSPAATPAQAIAPATTTTQSEIKPQTEGAKAAETGPRSPQAERATPPKLESNPQSPSPAPAAAAPMRQPLASTVPNAQPDAKQQAQSAAASTPTAPVSPNTSSAAPAAHPDAKQQVQSAGAPVTLPPSQGEHSTAALPEAKQQPRPPASALAGPTPAQGQQSVAVAPQSTAKQPAQAPTQPAQAAAAATESLPATPPPPASKPPALVKTPGNTGSGTAVERFASEVQRVASQVLDQRDYPKDARGKDWQGTTQIEVRYAAAGYIQSIVVGETSGYPPLDDTALQIARNMRLPTAPEELRSRDFAVRFPIVFRLHNP